MSLRAALLVLAAKQSPVKLEIASDKEQERPRNDICKFVIHQNCALKKTSGYKPDLQIHLVKIKNWLYTH